MSGAILAVTGTSTDVGKTIVTAALAAAAQARGATVGVCKPAQTGVEPGEPGDLDTIAGLAGPVTTTECARYPDPLAPETAARLSGLPPVRRPDIRCAVEELATTHDLTLVEGAGGVLVRLAESLTLLDVAADVVARVIVVVPPGLGALNHAELTVDAIRARGLEPAGLVIGTWPERPDLAMRTNRDDLPRLTGVPVVGVIDAGAGALDRAAFRAAAPGWIDTDWLDAEIRRPPGLRRPAPGNPATAPQISPTAPRSRSAATAFTSTHEGVLS